jgi:hypothetical protein
MAGHTPEGVPSRQTMPSCPEMPIRLDTGPCVWMPRQPFIYGDKDNMTFAVVTGTFIGLLTYSRFD